MADVFEVKFGDLQADERYKRLERSIKLASVKKRSKGERRNPGPCDGLLTESSLNISSIDPCAYYSAFPYPYRHSSKASSEVIASSSNNARRAWPERNSVKYRRPIVTSSVKDDYSPCAFGNASHSAERTRVIRTCTPVHATNTMPLPRTGANVVASEQPTPGHYQDRVARWFSRWKVTLDEQAQLIVKGRSNSGKYTRSKPIVRRLSAQIVESVHKHWYRLEGDLVDERNELPDYVRGKFRDGFPDDWQNVHQVWTAFVRQGCPATFRWPTAVAESDEDLRSEMTDVTITCTKARTRADLAELELTGVELNSSRPIETSSWSPYSRGIAGENVSKQDGAHRNGGLNDSCTQTYITGATGTLIYSANPGSSPPCSAGWVHAGHDAAQSTATGKNDAAEQTRCRSSATCPINIPQQIDSLYEMVKENKLHSIVDNLLLSSTHVEYLCKFITILDHLKHATLSVRGTEDVARDTRGATANQTRSASTTTLCREQDGELEGRKSRTYRSTNRRANQAVESTTESESCETEEEPTPVSVPDETMNGSPANTNDEVAKSCCAVAVGNLDSDSESEVYAGVRKIAAEQILLRQRGLLRGTWKRTVRRKVQQANRPKNNIARARYIQQSSTLNATATTKATHGAETSSRQSRKIDFSTDDSTVNSAEEAEKEVHGTHSYTYNPLLNSSAKHRDSVQKLSATEVLSSYACQSTANLVNNERGNDRISCDEVVAKPNTEGTCEEEQYGDRSTKSVGTTQSVPDGGVLTEKPRRLRSQRKENFMVPTIEDQLKTVEEYKARTTGNERPVQKVSPSWKRSTKKVSNDFPIPRKKDARDTVQDLEKQPTNEVAAGRPPAVLAMPTSTTMRAPTPSAESSDRTPSETSTKPKLLTAWSPRVVHRTESNSELGLIFHGKLLNEAGHVVRRKFVTKLVRRRVSATLIETVDAKLYQLVGALVDLNNAIPKELLIHCRYGCPLRIEEFCELWVNLCSTDKVATTPDMHHDTSMEILNVPVSSKGRKILPPLSYWTGERVALRDNNLVYSPGTTKESLMTSVCETFNKATNVDTKDMKNLPGSTTINEDGGRLTKRLLASSDSHNEEKCSPVRKRRKANLKGEPSTLCYTEASKDKATRPLGGINVCASDGRVDRNGPLSMPATAAPRPMTSKSRAPRVSEYDNPSIFSANPSRPIITDSTTPDKMRDHTLMCSYYKSCPSQEDALSDDQLSHV